MEKPAGKKRRELEEWFKGPEGLQALFRGRVLAFDEQAALIWARLMSQGTQAGRPRSAFDRVVAAIGEANDCVVVTDNEKHFPGVKLLNPPSAISGLKLGPNGTRTAETSNRKLSENMVSRDGVEPPTSAFSGPHTEDLIASHKYGNITP